MCVDRLVGLEGDFGEKGRRATRAAIGLSLILWGGMIVTGVAHDLGYCAVSHRWLGHILFVSIWLLVPFSLGLFVQRGARIIPSIAWAMLVIGAVFLSSLTGYLGPSNTAPFSAETINRFNILHRFAFPAVTGILLAQWLYALRPKPQNLKS